LPPRVLCYCLRTTAAPRPHENTRRMAHRLRTGSLRVSNYTRKPEQRMCQTMSMSEKSKNMRNRRVSDVTAWSRTDWDEECVTTYRHVPKCRPCLRRFDSSAPSRLFPGSKSYRVRKAQAEAKRNIHQSITTYLRPYRIDCKLGLLPVMSFQRMAGVLSSELSPPAAPRRTR
jgi:hypothetical protein